MTQDVSKLVFKQSLKLHRIVNKEKYMSEASDRKFSFWKLSLAKDSAGLCLLRPCLPVHCKWRAGEDPIQTSGSDLCIPRYETAGPRYFQNRIIMFCLPVSTFMYLWAIYIFPGSVCQFCCSLIGRPTWEYINCTSARSHPHSARSHPHSARSHPRSARSHPQLG